MPGKLKVAAAALITAALIATGAGCADSGSGGGAAETELTLWTHEFEPLQQAMTEKWIPEFEAANPSIKVKLTTIPLAGAVSYDSKLLSALSGGGGPDVWDMGDWNFAKYQSQGFLEPIDPTAFGYTDHADLIKAYDPAATKAITFDGRVHGMFSEFNTLALYYNTKVFADAGVPALPEDKPVSWDQIGEIGQKLRKESNGAVERTGYQFGFFANYRDAQWYAQNFYTLLRQNGQQDVFVDGKPAGDSEAVRKTLQTFYDFTYKYQAYDPSFLNNWFADIPNGRAAMVQAGSWYAPAALSANKDFEFKVAPTPVVNPDDKSTYKDVSYSWDWAVNANTDAEKKAAAQKFLAFILGKKGETTQADYWFNQCGYLQPSAAYLESDEFGKHLTDQPYLQRFLDALKNYEVSPVEHMYDEPGQAIVAAIDAVVYNKTDPAVAADTLQKTLQGIKQ